MPLNFPTNPTNGQAATVNGRLYQWNGSVWQLVTYVLPNATNNTVGGVKVGYGLQLYNSVTIKDIGSMLYLWANFR